MVLAARDEMRKTLDVLIALQNARFETVVNLRRERESKVTATATCQPFSVEGSERALRLGLNGVFMMLLALICGNVGALVFARIATRERELTVRTA